MLARSIQRPAALIGRRTFHSSPRRLGSPYHYPEGPLNNIPFNVKSKFFPVGFWGTTIFAFSLPFIMAVWQTKKNKA